MVPNSPSPKPDKSLEEPSGAPPVPPKTPKTPKTPAASDPYDDDPTMDIAAADLDELAPPPSAIIHPDVVVNSDTAGSRAPSTPKDTATPDPEVPPEEDE